MSKKWMEESASSLRLIVQGALQCCWGLYQSWWLRWQRPTLPWLKRRQRGRSPRTSPKAAKCGPTCRVSRRASGSKVADVGLSWPWAWPWILGLGLAILAHLRSQRCIWQDLLQQHDQSHLWILGQLQLLKSHQRWWEDAKRGIGYSDTAPSPWLIGAPAEPKRIIFSSGTEQIEIIAD